MVMSDLLLLDSSLLHNKYGDLVDKIPYLESLLNERGHIRRGKVLDQFHHRKEDRLSYDDIVLLYQAWRDDPEYLGFEGIKEDGSSDFLFAKCAKRGNDVYIDRVKQNIDFLDGLPSIIFFDPDTRGIKFTSALFITLTYGHKQCLNCGKHYDLKSSACPFCNSQNSIILSPYDAWQSIAKDLHLFETKLRQHYGNFVKFRVWEASDSFYPHVHIFYFFLDHAFRVHRHYNPKKKKETWRIPDRDRDIIQGLWHSYVDIQGCYDTMGSFSEVKKYITKDLWTSKGDKTNAMIWLFNKRSYWISTWSPYKRAYKCPNKGCEGILERKEYTNWDSLMEDSITVYECPICGMRYFDKELTIKDQTHILKPKSEWSKESGNYKKDFVGAIWGYDVWYDLYFGHLEAGEDLGEGNMSDLVIRMLHSCKDYYVKIIFLGVFSGHSLGISSKIWFTSLKDPPPDVLEQINEAKMQDSFSHENIFKEGLP